MLCGDFDVLPVSVLRTFFFRGGNDDPYKEDGLLLLTRGDSYVSGGDVILYSVILLCTLIYFSYECEICEYLPAVFVRAINIRPQQQTVVLVVQ